MVYSWNSTFNNSPAGSAFGSVIARVLRETKAAFYERFTVEHTIAEGASPQVEHTAGGCSVVGFKTEDEELLHVKTGTLIYEYENSKLYGYVVGGSPYTAGSFDHADYDNLDADDHTQYAQSLEDVTGALTVSAITNIDESAADNSLLVDSLHTGADHTPFTGTILLDYFNIAYVDVYPREVTELRGVGAQRVYAIETSIENIIAVIPHEWGPCLKFPVGLNSSDVGGKILSDSDYTTDYSTYPYRIFYLTDGV